MHIEIAEIPIRKAVVYTTFALHLYQYGFHAKIDDIDLGVIIYVYGAIDFGLKHAMMTGICKYSNITGL